MTLQVQVSGAPSPMTDAEKTDVLTTLGAVSTATLTAHTGNTSNPHGVTKTQVGLGNVDNTADADKPVSTAQATAIAVAVTAHVDAADPHPGKYAAQGHTHALLMTTDERTKLGALPTAAELATAQAAQDTAIGGKAPASHTHTPASIGAATEAQGSKADTALQPGSQLTQGAVTAATAAGVALLGAANAAAQRTALGLGTAATTDATAYATAAQGTKADSALAANADAIADVLEAAATGAPADLARIQASVSGDLKANEIAFIGDSRTRYGLRNWYKGATATTNITALPIDYLGTAGVGVNADTTGTLEYRATDKNVRWITAISGDTQGAWTPLQVGRMTVESGGAGRGLTMVVRSLATMPATDVTVAFTLTASMYYLTGWDSTGGIAAYGFQTEVVSQLRNGPTFDYLGAGGAMSHEMIELLPWYAAQAGGTGIDVIRCGTNDISNTSISAATTIANMAAVFNARLALGRRLVICGEPARWGINTTSALTTQQRADLIAINKAYRAYCDARPDTTRYVDLLSLSVDAGYSDLRPATGYLVDTVHDGGLLVSDGGAAIAQACVELGARRAPPRMRGDATNLMAAGMFAGTGGTLGLRVTGTVPTGFSGAARTGDADIAAVSSLVARTDGQKGNWWQMAVTATAAGQRMDMGRTADTLASLGLAAGDWVEFEIDAEVSALTGTMSSFEVFLFIYGGTSVRTQIVFPPRIDGVKYGRSPRIRLPVGTTNIQFNAQAFPGASSAVTVRLGDLFVRKVA